jgi:hypothetical protein
MKSGLTMSTLRVVLSSRTIPTCPAWMISIVLLCYAPPCEDPIRNQPTLFANPYRHHTDIRQTPLRTVTQHPIKPTQLSLSVSLIAITTSSRQSPLCILMMSLLEDVYTVIKMRG